MSVMFSSMTFLDIAVTDIKSKFFALTILQLISHEFIVKSVLLPLLVGKFTAKILTLEVLILSKNGML